MTVSTYAVVENGVVTNTVLWDSESDWTPPAGSKAYALPTNSSVSIGWTTTDGVNYAAPPAFAPISS